MSGRISERAYVLVECNLACEGQVVTDLIVEHRLIMSMERCLKKELDDILATSFELFLADVFYVKHCL